MSSVGLGVQKYTPKNCVKLFKTAKKSIRIIIPDVSIDFFRNDAIVNSLHKAVTRGVLVEVAYWSLAEMNKVGILSIPGIVICRLKEMRERFIASIDNKHAIVQRQKREAEKIDIGIITLNASNTLAREIDKIFNEITIKKGP